MQALSISLIQSTRYVPQLACAWLLVMLAAAPARAQSPNAVGVRGFAAVGSMTFTAKDTFDAVLDTNRGLIVGGGGQVLLPRGIYAQVGASRFKRDGQRVFIGPADEVFRLGIPVHVSITPLEVTGGYRFTAVAARIVPYAGAGYSSVRYQESSEFAEPNEDVDDRFSGFHVVGGVEYQALRWLAVGGEVSWSSIADALGRGGVSAHFGDDNLGGTSLRLKIAVGR